MLQLKPLALLLGVALFPAMALAQDDTAGQSGAGPASTHKASHGKPSHGEVNSLPSVNVVGSLGGSIQLDTPGTVSVINRQQMDRHLVTNIRELVKYEPGVSVIGTAGRFGLDSFNIRGLSGNRSVMLVDDIPMPASFGADVAGGSFRTGRDYMDMDQMENVTIIRGPSSALYPSDALGGTVAMVTKDPSDYLKDGKPVYASLKETYDGTDRSFGTTVTVAGGNKHDALMLVMSHSNGHETGDMGTIGGVGSSRTRPDPLTYQSTSFLLKYAHTADSGRVDRYTVEGTDRRTRTDGLSDVTSTVPYYRSQDDNRRIRASFGQWFPNLNSPLADTLRWNVYWQQSTAHTNTQTVYQSTIDRYYYNTPTNERTLGGKLVAVKQLGEGDAVSQTISYGVEASATFDSANVDGYGVNTVTGASGSGSAYLPGDYPLHLIPTSTTRRYSIFGQDELSFLDGRLVVTPGLRLDHYEYRPSDDEMYRKYNGNYVASNYIQTHPAPKLGVVWHINDAISAYLDYSHGYRPPLYSEISGAWNEQPIAGFNIAFLPNPNLKSETSRNVELGFRGKGDAGWFSIGGYYDRYRNFIWSGYALSAAQVPAWASAIGDGAAYNYYYQAVNASKAFIKGAEASGALRLGHFSPALEGWAIRGSAAVATGRLIEPGDTGYSPLNTVDPAKLVVGVTYDASQWGAEFTATAVRKHTGLDEANTFRPPGYATLDLYAHYSPIRNVELYAGISNLADRKYWDWGNLNGGTLGNFITGNGLNDAGTNGVPADRLTMPGRTFSATIKVIY
ncbi:TonB-dependent hemoglobin/transferrin/lactoferrin family receptor [Frateuria aurantia]